MFGEDTGYDEMIRDFEAIENDPNKNVDEAQVNKVKFKDLLPLSYFVYNGDEARKVTKDKFEYCALELGDDTHEIDPETVVEIDPETATLRATVVDTDTRSLTVRVAEKGDDDTFEIYAHDFVDPETWISITQDVLVMEESKTNEQEQAKVNETKDFVDKFKEEFLEQIDAGTGRDTAIKNALNIVSHGAFTRGDEQEQKHWFEKFSSFVESYGEAFEHEDEQEEVKVEEAVIDPRRNELRKALKDKGYMITRSYKDPRAGGYFRHKIEISAKNPMGGPSPIGGNCLSSDQHEEIIGIVQSNIPKAFCKPWWGGVTATWTSGGKEELEVEEEIEETEENKMDTVSNDPSFERAVEKFAQVEDDPNKNVDEAEAKDFKPGDRVVDAASDVEGVIVREIDSGDPEYEEYIRKYEENYGVDFEEISGNYYIVEVDGIKEIFDGDGLRLIESEEGPVESKEEVKEEVIEEGAQEDYDAAIGSLVALVSEFVGEDVPQEHIEMVLHNLVLGGGAAGLDDAVRAYGNLRAEMDIVDPTDGKASTGEGELGYKGSGPFRRESEAKTNEEEKLTEGGPVADPAQLGLNFYKVTLEDGSTIGEWADSEERAKGEAARHTGKDPVKVVKENNTKEVKEEAKIEEQE